LSLHIGSLITFELQPPAKLKLWSSDVIQTRWWRQPELLAEFDSKHVVMFLQYNVDKKSIFVVSQFGVGWVSTEISGKWSINGEI
jgi:hypothetical protein